MDLMIPFNSINGDRTYTAEDISEMFAAALTNGVHPSPSDSLLVTADEGFTLAILPGRCAINGRLGVNRAAKTLALDPPAGSLPRIDSVVLRLDLAGRSITEHILKGFPAAIPEPAELTRDAGIYEICLAHVLVEASAQSITQGAITDTRHDTELCGIMSSLVEIDADGLFGQYQSIFEEWLGSVKLSAQEWLELSQTQFESWFEGLQVLLDGDVALSIINETQLLKGRMASVEENQQSAVYEAARFSGVIAANEWAEDSTLGLFFTDIACVHAAVDSDVVITLSPESLLSPVLHSGTTLEGAFRVYASGLPDGAVEYTAVVQRVGAV